MTNVIPLSMLSAALLAMVGALFGVAMARVLWADDLKHAQQLRQIWDKTEKSLVSRIEIQDRTIEILKRRLGEPAQ